jgi:hypothetical protein
MHPTEPLNHRPRVSGLLPRRRPRFMLVTALLTAVATCGIAPPAPAAPPGAGPAQKASAKPAAAPAPSTAPAPSAAPSASPAPATKPASSPMPAAAAPASIVSAPAPIVIHQADLYGQFQAQKGPTITILSLLVTSQTAPAAGNQAVLFYKPTSPKGDGDWIPLGDVEVKTPLDKSGKLQITIVGDEKKFGIPGPKKPLPIPKNTRVKLRWQW